MSEYNAFSLNNIFRAVFCFIALIISLGLFNSSWLSLLIVIIYLMCLYSGKIKRTNYNLFLIIIICTVSITIKSLILLPSINVGANVFIGGEKYKNSVFNNKLPKKIYKRLNEDFISSFPNSVSAPDKKLFDTSVKQMLFKNQETKTVNKINWKNRYEFSLGAFNDANYNAYGKQQPKRTNLPFFVKYTIPTEYYESNSDFCWKGLAFIGKNKIIEKLHKKRKCIPIEKNINNKTDPFVIWLVETNKTPHLEAELIQPLGFKIKLFFLYIIKILCCFLILIFSFRNLDLKKCGIFIFCSLFSSVVIFAYEPTLLYKFVLFEGGNDGLLYVHFAHLISDNLSSGNFIDAFKGGEAAYDLMPFYRYIWVLNYLLFEESPWIFFLILSLFPLVIFSILKNFFNKKWVLFFLFCWFILPLFEAFGFFHYYYVKLTVRGFAEPLSYLCFFSSLILIFKLIDSNFSSKQSDKIVYFFVGILLSLAMGLRANIVPCCAVLLFYLAYKNLKLRTFSNIIVLGLGFSPILILPIHNYYFTNKFIPLTIAAYKDWNLGAKPTEYLELIMSILHFEINYSLLNKISNHIEGEIKLYELWYHLSIISCIYYVFKKNAPEKIRLLSCAALSMISLILFYHVGGRYSYLTWTLALFVISFFMKDYLVPIFISNRKKNVT